MKNLQRNEIIVSCGCTDGVFLADYYCFQSLFNTLQKFSDSLRAISKMYEQVEHERFFFFSYYPEATILNHIFNLGIE